MYDLSLERLRTGTATSLAMLLVFAGLSFVCAQVLAHPSAAAALNKPVRAQIEALKDSDAVARWFAATTFPRTYDPSMVPALVEALKDSDAAVRAGAAVELGLIGPDAKAMVPALVEALKDSSLLVRWSAADALGAIGTGARAAVPALVEAQKDSDLNVRKAAAEALDAIGP